MKADISEYIEAYGDELSRLCVALCKNRHDAEDLYQTTWEKVIKSIKTYDKEKPFDKWLWSVCANAHKDMLRNPFRRRVFTVENQEILERKFTPISGKGANLEEYIMLHKALNELEPDLHRVVALYYFKDFSVSDLSEILKIPEGTVKSRLYRAREVIREELLENGE